MNSRRYFDPKNLPLLIYIQISNVANDMIDDDDDDNGNDDDAANVKASFYWALHVCKRFM